MSETILGIGNDLIEVSRIKSVIQKRGKAFLDRVFTKDEQIYCLKHKESERHFAGRFAVKEAVAKALGTGFGRRLKWVDLEVINESSGRPTLKFSDAFLSEFGHAKILITLSHSKDLAMATAIWISSTEL